MTRFLLYFVCVLVFCTADYFATKWGQLRDGRSLLLALAVGPFAYVLFGYLAANASLAKMGAYVNVGVVLGTVVAAFVLLGERPNRLTWMGLGAIVLGLAMLGLGRVERGAA